jgi:hypothetical protein
MTDCCQDKTSPYQIREEEWKLFEAAIRFGDWLAEFPAITGDEIKAIRDMQNFLQNLPSAPPPGLHGEFGFRVESISGGPDLGHFGCWSVSVCRAMLEVYFCSDDNIPEFEWLLCPGCENTNDLRDVDKWIDQISAPFSLLGEDQQLVVEASTWQVKD